MGASSMNHQDFRNEGSAIDRLRNSSSSSIDFMDGDDDTSSVIVFQQDSVLHRISDHFSLKAKSTLVQSRKNQEGVYILEPSFSHQVVIEENLNSDKGLKVEVKTVSNVTIGHKLLNSFYAVIAGLFAGILLVFFIQMLLHVVLNLAAQAGMTDKVPQPRVWNLLGTIFALVSFSHYFAEALVIAGRFIVDCYTDQPLAKTLILKTRKRGYLIVEWCLALCFLLIPSLVGMTMLSLKNDEWWLITSTTWFLLVMGFFGLFSFSAVYYEIIAAYNFVASRPGVNAKSVLDVMKHSILLRQRRSYSGHIFKTTFARNEFSNSLVSPNSLRFNLHEDSNRVSTPMWTRLVKLLPKFMFRDLSDGPKKLYTINDVNGRWLFLTRHNWSLERVLCRPKHSRYVAVVNGAGALTKGQMRSSVLCAALYFILVADLVASILIWFNASVGIILFVLAILLLFNYRPALDTYALIKVGWDLIAVQVAKKKMANDPRDDEEGGERLTTEASEVICHVLTIERVREATAGLCWFCFAVELGFTFVWPTITLFLFNPNFGGSFLLASIISNCRWYCSVVSAVQESGVSYHDSRL
eukprot:scaffold279_cov90-Cylindrotheca_fusiformis.AAC.7